MPFTLLALGIVWTVWNDDSTMGQYVALPVQLKKMIIVASVNGSFGLRVRHTIYGIQVKDRINRTLAYANTYHPVYSMEAGLSLFQLWH